jgi:hypothetical protein
MAKNIIEKNISSTQVIEINDSAKIPLSHSPYDVLIDREYGTNWNVVVPGNTIYYSFLLVKMKLSQYQQALHLGLHSHH